MKIQQELTTEQLKQTLEDQIATLQNGGYPVGYKEESPFNQEAKDNHIIKVYQETIETYNALHSNDPDYAVIQRILESGFKLYDIKYSAERYIKVVESTRQIKGIQDFIKHNQELLALNVEQSNFQQIKLYIPLSLVNDSEHKNLFKILNTLDQHNLKQFKVDACGIYFFSINNDIERGIEGKQEQYLSYLKDITSSTDLSFCLNVGTIVTAAMFGRLANLSKLASWSQPNIDNDLALAQEALKNDPFKKAISQLCSKIYSRVTLSMCDQDSIISLAFLGNITEYIGDKEDISFLAKTVNQLFGDLQSNNASFTPLFISRIASKIDYYTLTVEYTKQLIKNSKDSKDTHQLSQMLQNTTDLKPELVVQIYRLIIEQYPKEKSLHCDYLNTMQSLMLKMNALKNLTKDQTDQFKNILQSFIKDYSIICPKNVNKECIEAEGLMNASVQQKTMFQIASLSEKLDLDKQASYWCERIWEFEESINHNTLAMLTINVYKKIGEYHKAIQYIPTLLSRPYAPYVKEQIISIFKLLGFDKTALQYFNSIADTNVLKEYSKIYQNALEACKQSKQYDKALEFCVASDKDIPRNQLIEDIGSFIVKLGTHKGQCGNFIKALDVECNKKNITLQAIYKTASEISVKCGQVDKAIFFHIKYRSLEQSIDMHKELGELYTKLAESNLAKQLKSEDMEYLFNMSKDEIKPSTDISIADQIKLNAHSKALYYLTISVNKVPHPDTAKQIIDLHLSDINQDLIAAESMLNKLKTLNQFETSFDPKVPANIAKKIMTLHLSNRNLTAAETMLKNFKTLFDKKFAADIAKTIIHFHLSNQNLTAAKSMLEEFKTLFDKKFAATLTKQIEDIQQPKTKLLQTSEDIKQDNATKIKSQQIELEQIESQPMQSLGLPQQIIQVKPSFQIKKNDDANSMETQTCFKTIKTEGIRCNHYENEQFQPQRARAFEREKKLKGIAAREGDKSTGYFDIEGETYQTLNLNSPPDIEGVLGLYQIGTFIENIPVYFGIDPSIKKIDKDQFDKFYNTLSTGQVLSKSSTNKHGIKALPCGYKLVDCNIDNRLITTKYLKYKNEMIIFLFDDVKNHAKVDKLCKVKAKIKPQEDNLKTITALSDEYIKILKYVNESDIKYFADSWDDDDDCAKFALGYKIEADKLIQLIYPPNLFDTHY